MSDTKIIGRHKEQDILRLLYKEQQSHFVVVTGRRRVGKTFLVKETFANKISFDFSGILNASMKDQLKNFDRALKKQLKTKKKDTSENWMDAFDKLSKQLERTKKKQVIFIDELPWLDTHKSNFVQALDWFWNNWAAYRNIILIVCGSATSWMMNKLINHKGGLHNRITAKIHLNPFTLQETERYLLNRKIKLSRYEITQLYMVMGGIPHYLKEIKKGESSMQAVQRICFEQNGLLNNEFHNLYQALFTDHRNYTKVVMALAQSSKGLNRNEILKRSKLKDGGTFSKVLEELEWCNFIQSQPTPGKKVKEMRFRLVDEFSLFYLRFMYKKRNVNWLQLSSGNIWKSWSGYAFEGVCIKHTPQIKAALGIASVYTETYCFHKKGNTKTKGAEIDFIIERNDGIINIFEAKFYNKPYTITSSSASELRKKIAVFEQQIKTRKTIHLCFISSFGTTENQHSIGIIQHNLDINSLF